MIGLSLMNTIGFPATNISDALARRSAIVTKTSNAAIKVSNAASDLKKWRKDRDAITEARSVEEIKLELVRNRKKVDRIDRDAFEATVGCTLLTADITKACDAVLSLVQAMAQAKRRDDVTKKIDDAEKPQRAPAAENKQEGTPAAEGNQESTTITSADPQAEMVPKLVKWITRGWIEPSSDDAVMLRILGLTVPPVLPGLFLMFVSVR